MNHLHLIEDLRKLRFPEAMALPDSKAWKILSEQRISLMGSTSMRGESEFRLANVTKRVNPPLEDIWGGNALHHQGVVDLIPDLLQILTTEESVTKKRENTEDQRVAILGIKTTDVVSQIREIAQETAIESIGVEEAIQINAKGVDHDTTKIQQHFKISHYF